MGELGTRESEEDVRRLDDDWDDDGHSSNVDASNVVDDDDDETTEVASGGSYPRVACFLCFFGLRYSVVVAGCASRGTDRRWLFFFSFHCRHHARFAAAGLSTLTLTPGDSNGNGIVRTVAAC